MELLTKNLKPGFYILTKDVPNPKADPRYGSMSSTDVWPRGMRVRVYKFPDGGGFIMFSDGTHVYYGPSQDHIPTGNFLVPHLIEAPFAVGQMFWGLPVRKHLAAQIVAMALEKGMLTRGHIEYLLSVLSVNNANLGEFCQRHWI